MISLQVVSRMLLVIGIIALVSPPLADATQGGTGSTRAIAGRVLQVGVDTPIPGVQVRVRGERIGSSTGAQGRFALADVPAGPVELVLRHPCYFPVQVTLPATGDVSVAIGLPYDQASNRRAGCGGLDARKPDTPSSPDTHTQSQ